MKRFLTNTFLLLITLVTLSFYSCKEDVDKAAVIDILNGTWLATDLNLTGCTNPDENTETSLTCTSMDCMDFVFEQDTLGNVQYIRTTTVNGQSISTSGTYTLGSGSISLCEEEDGITTCVTYGLELSPTEFSFSSTNTDTGCTETLIYLKEE